MNIDQYSSHDSGVAATTAPSRTRSILIIIASVIIIWSGVLLTIFVSYVCRKGLTSSSSKQGHGSGTHKPASNSPAYRAQDGKLLEHTTRYLRHLIPPIFRSDSNHSAASNNKHVGIKGETGSWAAFASLRKKVIFELSRHHKYLSVLMKPLGAGGGASSGQSLSSSWQGRKSANVFAFASDSSDNNNFIFDCLYSGVRFATVKCLYIFATSILVSSIMSSPNRNEEASANIIGLSGTITYFAIIAVYILPWVNWLLDWAVIYMLTVPMATARDHQIPTSFAASSPPASKTYSYAQSLLSINNTSVDSVFNCGSVPGRELRVYFNAAVYAPILQTNLESLNLRKNISQLLKQRHMNRNNSNAACVLRNSKKVAAGNENAGDSSNDDDDDSESDDSEGGGSDDDEEHEERHLRIRRSVAISGSPTPPQAGGAGSSSNSAHLSAPSPSTLLLSSPVASRYQMRSSSIARSLSRSPVLTSTASSSTGSPLPRPEDKHAQTKRLFSKLRYEIDMQRKQLRSHSDRELFDGCWGIDPAGEFAVRSVLKATDNKQLSWRRLWCPARDDFAMTSTQELIKAEIYDTLCESEMVGGLLADQATSHTGSKRLPSAASPLLSASSGLLAANTSANSSTGSSSVNMVIGRTILELFLFDLLGRNSVAAACLLRKMVVERSAATRQQSNTGYYTYVHPSSSVSALQWSIRKDAINWLYLLGICCFNSCLLFASVCVLMKSCYRNDDNNCYHLIQQAIYIICGLVALECLLFETVECVYIHVAGALCMQADMDCAVDTLTGSLERISDVKASSSNSNSNNSHVAKHANAAGKYPALCAVQENEICLNAAEYFFVSHRLALQFPNLLESQIVKAFMYSRTYEHVVESQLCVGGDRDVQETMCHVPVSAHRRLWYFNASVVDSNADKMKEKDIVFKLGIPTKESMLVIWNVVRRWCRMQWKSLRTVSGNMAEWVQAINRERLTGKVCKILVSCRIRLNRSVHQMRRRLAEYCVHTNTTVQVILLRLFICLGLWLLWRVYVLSCAVNKSAYSAAGVAARSILHRVPLDQIWSGAFAAVAKLKNIDTMHTYYRAAALVLFLCVACFIFSLAIGVLFKGKDGMFTLRMMLSSYDTKSPVKAKSLFSAESVRSSHQQQDGAAVDMQASDLFGRSAAHDGTAAGARDGYSHPHSDSDGSSSSTSSSSSASAASGHASPTGINRYSHSCTDISDAEERRYGSDHIDSDI
jgi:hypothetical protein